METQLECHSSAAEESADDDRDSSRASAASFSSQSSSNVNLHEIGHSNSSTSYVKVTRNHLPLIVQKEMSKLFAARCDATQLDLIPFKVVMDIIREHFTVTNKPELLRVLIRLLCQYQPFQGEKEYRKLISLCDDLLISIDDEVRETFISMIPAPIDYRHGFHSSSSNSVCGHYVRDMGLGRREENLNPLSELIKRPLLSYQAMPTPLFDQPFLKPSLNLSSNNSDTQMDPHKFFPASQTRSSSVSEEVAKSDFPMMRPHLPPSNSFGHPPWMPMPTTLPLSLNNNSLMWFARASGPSPLHSPTIRSQIANPMRHSLFPSSVSSLVPSLQGFNQHDLKKHQILQRKQELMKNIDTLTKLKSLESSMASDISHLNSDQMMSSITPPANFPLTWLTIPNYCGLRPSNPSTNDVSRLSHTVSNPSHLENQVEQDGSYYLEQLLKRPETPDCSDPWGSIKKPRKQTKHSPANNLIGKRKKKSKK